MDKIILVIMDYMLTLVSLTMCGIELALMIVYFKNCEMGEAALYLLLAVWLFRIGMLNLKRCANKILGWEL